MAERGQLLALKCEMPHCYHHRKGVPPAHGTNRWTAAMVRKAYVS